jgi:hypothetical protein
MKRVIFSVVTVCFGGLMAGPPTPAPAAAGDAEYTVVIHKCVVKDRKADGAHWDVNEGKPDLRVKIRNGTVKDSKEFSTKEATDIFSHDFNETTTIRFKTGHKLEIQVVDVDVAADDLIGAINVNTDKVTPKGGRITLENFGQVVTLEIEVKKL